MTGPKVTKLHTLTGHNDCVYTLQPTNVPNKFFSGAGDGMVVLWDLDRPEEGKLIAHLQNSVYALHYHPVSNNLIIGHNYEGIHVIDWVNKAEVGSLKFTTASIFDIVSHKDLLFVATGDGTVYTIDYRNLRIVNAIKHSDKSARTLAINAKQKELVVGYSDHWIRVFDLETMQLKTEWNAHDNSVFAIRYSPDFKFLLSSSRDARLKVWNVGARYAQQTEVVAHMYAINHLDFSPDGKHFVTCSMDKSIKVWDAEQFQLLKVIDKSRHAGHGTSVNKLLWTNFSDQLVSASDDRTISIWNIIF